MKHKLIILLSIFSSAIFAQNITSTFDSDDEGWRIINVTVIPIINIITVSNPFLPTFNPTGGPPNGAGNGHISIAENTTLGTYYFSAPATSRSSWKFLSAPNRFHHECRAQSGCGYFEWQVGVQVSALSFEQTF